MCFFNNQTKDSKTFKMVANCYLVRIFLTFITSINLHLLYGYSKYQ